MKKAFNTQVFSAVALLVTAFSSTSSPASAQVSGLQADLRSSAAVIPPSTANVTAPTAPPGAVVAVTHAWICDAAEGFAPVVPIENATDPFLAVGTTGNTSLPISATTVPASCGQSALQLNGQVYLTQGVVDTKNTPSSARGVLRTAIDPNTGIFVGPNTYIATTAGLDGDQPTAAALGPDGDLYVGFLKSGNVKKIVNPGTGTTQTVQSVGSTPQGHPARAFAFVGNDLYISSADALSVIHNATSASCTGGCNATVINDGFSGVVHAGMTSDGSTIYFSVAGSSQIPGSSQVWRYNPTTQLFAFVSQGGSDKNGANASNFSFPSIKTDLLALGASGDLWIGDDTSNATQVGAGRLWTISAAALTTLSGGNFIAGTNVQQIFNDLRGPWTMAFTTQQFTPTFNADGTFTAVLGNATTSGTWTLTPPHVVQPLGNAQAHLTFTQCDGVILFSADFLMLNLDTLVAMHPWTGSLGTPISGVLSKQTI